MLCEDISVDRDFIGNQKCLTSIGATGGGGSGGIGMSFDVKVVWLEIADEDVILEVSEDELLRGIVAVAEDAVVVAEDVDPCTSSKLVMLLPGSMLSFLRRFGFSPPRVSDLNLFKWFRKNSLTSCTAESGSLSRTMLGSSG